MNLRRQYALNFKRDQTNYFRLTALEDDVTFTISKGSTVKPANFSYLEYSINEGKTWTRMVNTNSTITITIPNIRIGDSVLFRGYGNNLSSATSTGTGYFTWFKSNKKFKVSGVLMTLLKGKQADENTSIGTSYYTFKQLFTDQANLIDAGDLIFPPDLTNWCYNLMFYRCTNLTKGPVLPALVLKERCYNSMFTACSKLTYIKMLATNISANSCLSGWMPGTNASLEFHYNPEATWLVTGGNGIPLQCVLFDDTEETDEEVTFIDSEVQRIALAWWGNRKPTLSVYNSTNTDWKNNIRIGGVQGKILKRQIKNVVRVRAQFAQNTLIQDMSDFNQFEGLINLGLGGLVAGQGFYGCTNLIRITLPSTLTNLSGGYSYGKGCFGNCSSLQELYMPDSITNLNSSCFSNCTALRYVRYSSNCSLPNGSHNNEFFIGCTNLEEIENFPQNVTIFPASSFKNCNKLDVSIFNLKKITYLGGYSLGGCINWPSEIVFSSLNNISESYALDFNTTGNCNVDKIYMPKVTNLGAQYSIESQARLLDFGNVTGGQFRPYHYTNIVNSDHYDTTIILRSKAVPSLTNIRNTYLKRLYVYPSIIDDFKTTYSTLASKTLPISGEQWVTDFGSSYEYADYPTAQAFSVDDSQDYYHEYTDYNSSLTMTTHFSGTSWRTIIFPTDRISGSNIEIAEITGVTITEVDDELDSFTLTTSQVTGDVITPGKPYLIRAIDGESTKTLSANPAPVFESIALPSITIQDADSKYQFVIKGTYEAKDDLVDSYVWDGSAWTLDSEISPMRAYITVTKLEQEEE